MAEQCQGPCLFCRGPQARSKGLMLFKFSEETLSERFLILSSSVGSQNLFYVSDLRLTAMMGQGLDFAPPQVTGFIIAIQMRPSDSR